MKMTCPPKVVPSAKLVVVEKERNTEYDTQTLPPEVSFGLAKVLIIENRINQHKFIDNIT